MSQRRDQDHRAPDARGGAIEPGQTTHADTGATWPAVPARGSSPFRSLMAYLLPLLRPYWHRQIEVLLLMALGLGSSLVLPLASKYLVDTILPRGRIGDVGVFLLVLLLVYLLSTSVELRRAYTTSWVANHVINELRARVFAHLLRLPHGFFARSSIGDLMAHLANDLAHIQYAMEQVSGQGLYLLLRALAAAATLIVLSPLLGSVVVLVLPLFALTYVALAAHIRRTSFELQERVGQTQATEQESLSGHATIKAFGLEQHTEHTYRARLSALLKVSLRFDLFASAFEAGMGLTMALAQLIILGGGGYLVLRGQITIGSLLAFIGLIPPLFNPIAVLAQLGQAIEGASGPLERINGLLQEPRASHDRAGAGALAPLEREIRLEQIRFGYEHERSILHAIDLSIPAGSHIAIVGPSGSGKSTLLNLLLRFWDPQQGRICFDGVDLRDVTVTSLREQIGVVFQDTFVFNTTLRENIALARPEATDAELTAAMRAARLDSYVAALSDGDATVLGEQGVRMSGGQRQRLAIARALLRNPRVLILDEATSALDSQTEREILETLIDVIGGRTTITITHRLALAAVADQIIVLDHGQIVEQGSHSDLLQAGGLYQRLYLEQHNNSASPALEPPQQVARLSRV